VDKKSIMIRDKFINMKFAKKNAGIKGFLFKEKNLLNFVKKLQSNIF
tara:strand:- start:1035 stop:1175 length:141 start_codon:yes stop_codon:yes gene_type:complete